MSFKCDYSAREICQIFIDEEIGTDVLTDYIETYLCEDELVKLCYNMCLDYDLPIPQVIFDHYKTHILGKNID